MLKGQKTNRLACRRIVPGRPDLIGRTERESVYRDASGAIRPCRGGSESMQRPDCTIRLLPVHSQAVERGALKAVTSHDGNAEKHNAYSGSLKEVELQGI